MTSKTIVCSKCGQPKPRYKPKSLVCRECRAAYMVRYYRQNRPAGTRTYNTTPVVDGKRTCPHCKRALPDTTEFFVSCGKGKRRVYCKQCHCEREREKTRAARHVVLSHYSNGTFKCACCGEFAYEFLALDHTNGDGCKHRREIGTGSGVSYYKWFINNNFPAGFRVLCHNCNLAIAFYGQCPHQNGHSCQTSLSSTKDEVYLLQQQLVSNRQYIKEQTAKFQDINKFWVERAFEAERKLKRTQKALQRIARNVTNTHIGPIAIQRIALEAVRTTQLQPANAIAGTELTNA